MHIFAREMYSTIYAASAWIILVFIWCKSIYFSWTYARKTIFYFFLSETMNDIQPFDFIFALPATPVKGN